MAESLTGGRGVWNNRRKPLTTSFRKCHILKPENTSSNRDSNPHSSIGGRLGKQTCQPSHHACDGQHVCFHVWLARVLSRVFIMSTAASLTLASGQQLDYETASLQTMTLTFTASDGYLTSDEMTLTIQLTPVNEPPYFDNGILTFYATFLEVSYHRCHRFCYCCVEWCCCDGLLGWRKKVVAVAGASPYE